MRFTIIVAILLLAAVPAFAEVHFGNNVYVGGHNFSNRTYGSFHLRVVKRLPGPPGCRIIPHGSYRRGDGTIVRGRIERCNLIAIPH